MGLAIAGLATGNPWLLAAGRTLGSVGQGGGLLSSFAAEAGNMAVNKGFEQFGNRDKQNQLSVPRRTGVFMQPQHYSQMGFQPPTPASNNNLSFLPMFQQQPGMFGRGFRL